MGSVKNILGGLGVLIVALTMVAPAGAKEQKVKLEDCPAAVQKTIKENANGGKIVEVEKDVAKDGTVSYEAEIKTADGKERDIVVAADGTLIKIEDEDEDDDEDDDDKDEDDD
jgi:hypothetical protein